MAKELWSNNEEGEMVKVYRAFNERDEAKFIVDIIKDWVKEGGCLSAGSYTHLTLPTTSKV